MVVGFYIVIMVYGMVYWCKYKFRILALLVGQKISAYQQYQQTKGFGKLIKLQFRQCDEWQP